MTRISAARIELIEREHKRAYKFLAHDHPLPWCWACGRGEFDRPLDWYGPWLIERAHIVKNPRREDARAVVLLCSLCHKCSHGEKVVTRERPVRYPQLSIEHLLWLKRNRDGSRFSLTFLQSCSIKKLPPMHKPPADYLREYERRIAPRLAII